jgi:hypothetical protein
MSLVPQFFCPRPWESMDGDEAERFCKQCGRAVHNLDTLSVGRKLELLRRPRSSLCGRYRLAIRQAVPGRERCYFEHLFKYGASVALVSAAFITLWEVSSAADRKNGQHRFYVGEVFGDPVIPMPPELYDETTALTLGLIACRPPALSPPPLQFGFERRQQLDIRVDDSEFQKLLRTPPPPPIPSFEPPRSQPNRNH